MTKRRRAYPIFMAAGAAVFILLSAGRSFPAESRADAPTAADLAGTWAGTLEHAGEKTPVALHLEPQDGGRMLIKMSVPAIHVSESPLGAPALQVSGGEVRLGPFVFLYDREAGTLRGTVPEGLVPVYAMPVVLRRVERFEAPPRPPAGGGAAPIAWTFDAGAPLWPGATVAENMVYAGGEDGVLHALEARTGKERWSFKAGGPIRSRATVSGEALSFASDDGFVYNLAAADGTERWRARVCAGPIVRLPFSDPASRFDRYGSDVTADGGRLYVGTHDGHVVGLDAKDGSRLWDFAAGDSVLAAPALHRKRLYFGSYDRNVYAIEAATGRLVWKHDARAPVVSTPAVERGRVIVGTRGYDLLGLDPKDGGEAWKRYLWFSWVESSARVFDGVAYVGSSDAAALFAFDARTGRPLWKTDVRGWAWGQPAVTAERVYIGTVGTGDYLAPHRGAALAIDRRTGRVVWRHDAPPPADDKPYGFAGSPAAGAGLVFFTGLDGKVYAFE